MSIIVAKGEQISKSQINFSPSKMMYSFPKTERFKRIRRAESQTFFYDLPNLKNQRSASFGFGNKYDISKNVRNVKVPYYNMPSDFDTIKPHTPSYTFGIARENYEKVYYETNKMFDKNIPGPGKYNFLKPLGSEALKFSLFGKGKNTMFEAANSVPGPGKYETISPSLKRRYMSSTFRNTPNVVWANSKSKRLLTIKNGNPGPGEYEIKPLINGTGSTFLSSFRSSTAKSLTSRKPELSNKNITPGPGAYTTFSEFGIYKSKKAAAVYNNEGFSKTLNTLHTISKGKNTNNFEKLSSSAGFYIDSKDNNQKANTNGFFPNRNSSTKAIIDQEIDINTKILNTKFKLHNVYKGNVKASNKEEVKPR